MKYEWDENKRIINLKKHGIDFQESHEIFNNPMLTKIDRSPDYGEDRYIGLGVTHKCVVLIIFTEPNEEKIRIISIRKATKQERKIYEKYLKDRLEKT